MNTYSLTHLSDSTLLCNLTSLVAQDRATTAALLAHLAEVDARKLYLPAAYPSMFAYCVHELRLSEDAAAKRIQAARVARRFPLVFEALADGRLHLTAVGLLAPHLTEDTANELLTAASHQSKAEIERLLAERYPRPNVLAWVAARPSSWTAPSPAQHAPAHVEAQSAPHLASASLAGEPAGDRPRVKPLSSQSFAVQFTVSQSGHEKLRYAQEVLGHQVRSGDLASVFERALDALIGHLEKQRFAATSRPSRTRRPSANPCRIPARVKRAVWERDEGRCTFVSEVGRRCPARSRLEFDHVQEVARGGLASVAGVRLRCRAHNQYGAECAFGVEFMQRKRDEARCAARARRQEAAARAAAEAERKAAQARAAEVIAPLRTLGFRADEARRAAALCETIPEASLEDRLRRALSYFHPPRTVAATGPGIAL